MKYKFLIHDYDGFSHPLIEDCDSDKDARKFAIGFCADVYFVEKVTVSRLLTDDPEGEAVYVADVAYGDEDDQED